MDINKFIYICKTIDYRKVFNKVNIVKTAKYAIKSKRRNNKTRNLLNGLEQC